MSARSERPLAGGPGESPIVDQFARPLQSLRISVTDRCNMRCGYCMPADEYAWLPRESLLTFEEIGRLAGVFVELGVKKLRLTGGEPLLRHDLPVLVGLLGRLPRIRDLALTTNGILLAAHAAALHRAGLRRITLSLDTLRPERMKAFARSDRHADVLAGFAAAQATGFKSLKLNSVVIRGYNDDELVDLIEFARMQQAEVRFIEYMDVGGATDWQMDAVVSRAEILERVAAHYGRVEPSPENLTSSAPAERFRLPDGTVFGVIASTTEPFCSTCDRARLTADGQLLLCLYAEAGLDLRAPLRDGANDDELAHLIRHAWTNRTDRGAEARVAAESRGALYQLSALRADPHREMHTRGG